MLGGCPLILIFSWFSLCAHIGCPAWDPRRDFPVYAYPVVVLLVLSYRHCYLSVPASIVSPSMYYFFFCRPLHWLALFSGNLLDLFSISIGIILSAQFRALSVFFQFISSSSLYQRLRSNIHKYNFVYNGYEIKIWNQYILFSFCKNYLFRSLQKKKQNSINWTEYWGSFELDEIE